MTNCSLKRRIYRIKQSYQPVVGICYLFLHQFSWFWKLFRMYTLLLLFNNALTIIVYASRIVNSNYTNVPTNDAYFSLSPFLDLARVLDIQPIYQHQNYNQFNNNIDASSTPDYFIKLYKSLTRFNGEGVGVAPYNADAIYGLMDSEIQSQRYYKYFIDEAINHTNILNSEFHLYRLQKGQRHRSRRSTGFLILKLYMVTSPSRKNTPFGNKLLEVKKVDVNKFGWIVFNMKDAVKKWAGPKKQANYGLFVSIQNTDGTYPPSSTVIFAQKSMQHKKKLQPIMSVYTKQNEYAESNEDEDIATELSLAFKNRDPERFQKIYSGEFYVPPVRVKRSDSSSDEKTSTGRRKHCALYPMNVDFDRMGWNQWIIGPRSFNAGVCAGPCPYPLGQSYHPTNHAVVQSIWYHLNPDNEIIGPVCCVPHTLKQLRMLYYNNEKVVVLKTYDNMIVKSCGCK